MKPHAVHETNQRKDTETNNTTKHVVKIIKSCTESQKQ